MQSIIFRRKTRSEDGTEDGGRIRVVLYFLFKRPALERRKEVEEIGVMVKKNGNNRSILRIIMSFLMLSREVRGRSEDGGRKGGREAGEGTRTVLAGHRSTFLS